jgi:hypothetical protein
VNDEIPPPLVPQPPSRDDTIFIPFQLADAARLQLEFLAKSSVIAKHHREAIGEWLRGYNSRLAGWVHNNYGPEGLRAADAMSRATAERMNKLQRHAQDQAERELFNSLEEQMGEDGGQ